MLKRLLFRKTNLFFENIEMKTLEEARQNPLMHDKIIKKLKKH